MYKEKDFGLPKLNGLSEKQIDVHLKLYSGYVKNVNTIIEKLDQLEQDPEKNKVLVSELRRRFPFEFDGMRMHEYYFEALGGDGKEDGEIVTAIEKQFGTYDKWLAQFKATGGMRGIGWTVLAHDPRADKLFNIWVNDHEIGHLAGTVILIAMDMWEHAFMIDYLPSEKSDYIAAFFKNLKWETVNERLSN